MPWLKPAYHWCLIAVLQAAQAHATREKGCDTSDHLPQFGQDIENPKVCQYSVHIILQLIIDLQFVYRKTTQVYYKNN